MSQLSVVMGPERRRRRRREEKLALVAVAFMPGWMRNGGHVTASA